MKRGDVQKTILACLSIAGILTLAAVAPNTIQLLHYLPGVNRAKKKHYIKSSVTRLKEKGLIDFVTREHKTFARLTSKGKLRLRQYQLDEIKIKRPNHWNEKWHIVIFDIKEAKRRVRDQLRMQLARFKFYRLQQSVWISPYECEEFIFMLKTAFGLGREVIYITADKIENDKKLREVFGLTD